MSPSAKSRPRTAAENIWKRKLDRRGEAREWISARCRIARTVYRCLVLRLHEDSRRLVTANLGTSFAARVTRVGLPSCRRRARPLKAHRQGRVTARVRPGPLVSTDSDGCRREPVSRANYLKVIPRKSATSLRCFWPKNEMVTPIQRPWFDDRSEREVVLFANDTGSRKLEASRILRAGRFNCESQKFLSPGSTFYAIRR